MKVYLDDERPTPDGWQRVYWPDEAIELLKTETVTHLSLDHDLGDDERGTGYDVVLWIEEAVATSGFQPPAITVHSANPSAREKMVRGVESIDRLLRAREATSSGRRIDPDKVGQKCLLAQTRFRSNFI